MTIEEERKEEIVLEKKMVMEEEWDKEMDDSIWRRKGWDMSVFKQYIMNLYKLMQY